MNPILQVFLSRAMAALVGAGAAAVPSISTGDATLPVPATMEEGIAQLVLAAISLGLFWYNHRKDNPKK